MAGYEIKVEYDKDELETYIQEFFNKNVKLTDQEYKELLSDIGWNVRENEVLSETMEIIVREHLYQLLEKKSKIASKRAKEIMDELGF